MWHPYLVLLPLIAAFALQAQIALAPADLVRDAVRQIHKGHDDHIRFTYIDRTHLFTFKKGGSNEIAHQSLRTFDITWINDHPYWRLIQVNDQPLPPKQEAKEQKQFDAAVASGKRFDGITQAEHAHWHEFFSSINIDQVFVHGTVFTEHPDLAVQDAVAHVIDAQVSSATDASVTCNWLYRFWLTGTESFPSRITVTAKDGDLPTCADTAREMRFISVDGLAKIAYIHSRFHGDKRAAASIDEQTFSNYRRFTTTVTLHPGSEVAEPPSH